MEAPGISTILATGGPALVKLAYSSGHSAIGVGPGNAPGLIDSTADIVTTISSIMCAATTVPARRCPLRDPPELSTSVAAESALPRLRCSENAQPVQDVRQRRRLRQ